MSRGSRHENEGRTKAGTYSAGHPTPQEWQSQTRGWDEWQQQPRPSPPLPFVCRVPGAQVFTFPLHFILTAALPVIPLPGREPASGLKGLRSHTAVSGGRPHTPGTWHRKSAPARYHLVRSGNYVNVCRCFPQNHYNKKSGAWKGWALVLLETTKDTSRPAADPPVLTGCRLRRNGHSTVRSSPAKSL